VKEKSTNNRKLSKANSSLVNVCFACKIACFKLKIQNFFPVASANACWNISINLLRWWNKPDKTTSLMPRSGGKQLFLML